MSITTFDYIPKIILGKTGNKLFNSINLFIRAIAFYIYFKTTDKLDILELILAYIFPIIYILYKISQENTEYIKGLFSFGKSSEERCIERRGADITADKHGDRNSIPEDAEACGDVVLGTINTASECMAVRSVGDSSDPDMYPAGATACLYIPKEKDENKSYKSYECSAYNTKNICNSQKDDDNNRLCQWNDISNTGTCSSDLYQLGVEPNQAKALTRSQCPKSCRYTGDVKNLTLSEITDDSNRLVFDSVNGLFIGDTLDFQTSDAAQAGDRSCDVTPTTYTIAGVNSTTNVVTLSQNVTDGEDTLTDCTITHTPLDRCSSGDSDATGSNGGSRMGYCTNK